MKSVYTFRHVWALSQAAYCYAPPLHYKRVIYYSSIPSISSKQDAALIIASGAAIMAVA
ncbi:hypothetical protein [Ktedonospora formicarum]|uniref:hypothetical protein n=1 Tax=Ktedonospora formicarum TaxID=2778364 RepID=UPI001C68A22A|nr:hypothetical protein [Ktedonospora formicarum]